MPTHTHEAFVGLLRKSSPREQTEIWKLVLGRAYTHERTSLLRELIQVMDRENQEQLHEIIREYVAETRARTQTVPQ